MARSARDMADQLIEIYSEKRKRYIISKDEFKEIAGKTALREAYLWDVDFRLREDGYLLIDMRDEKDTIAVIKIRTIMANWRRLPTDIIEGYLFDKDEWDEDD